MICDLRSLCAVCRLVFAVFYLVFILSVDRFSLCVDRCLFFLCLSCVGCCLVVVALRVLFVA